MKPKKRLKRIKQMMILVMGSTILLNACQANTSSTTGSSQPEVTGSIQPGLTTATQPGVTETTAPETIPSTQPAVTTPAATTAGPDGVKRGNLNRNYSNSGLYAENDQWVWFSKLPDYQLSRMKKDGTEQTSFNALHVVNINLMDDLVYYEVLEDVGEDMAGGLYRMKQDGTEVIKVSPVNLQPGGGCLIMDDWIFFTNAEEENHLYRMDLEGNDLTEMNEVPSFTLNYDDGWIFYLVSILNEDQSDDVYEIRRMKPDGSENTLLVKPGDSFFLADRGWLYYKDAQGSLYRMRYDATETTKILSDPVGRVNIDGENLYYTDVSTRLLMRSALDGSQPGELLDFPTSGVQIAAEWFYFRDEYQRMFRMKGDGSSIENAYSLEMVQPDPPGTSVVEGLGVINANLKWGSSFVLQGEWIYGIDYTGPENTIIRMKRDGSDRALVAQKQAWELNLIGDWLYFADVDASGSIARMKTDGSEYGVIYDSSVMGIIVRDNWIYFIDATKDRGIYKIKTDGTELTRLSEGQATALRLDGDWLYWSQWINDNWDSLNIYRTKVDGSAEELLAEDTISGLTVGEGYVYYGHSMDNSKSTGISRIRLDGTEKENILNQIALSLIGVYDGKIYYNDGMESAGMFRAELDGSDPNRVIGPGYFGNVQFLDDMILFQNESANGLQVMDLDGSNVRDLKK